MDHGEVLERLDGYRDGELDPETSREIATHLAACESCRATLEDGEATARSLSGLVRTEPSPAFVRAVMDRIAAEAEPAGVRWVTPALATGFGAACVFVVLGLVSGNGETGSAPPDLLEVGDRDAAETYRMVESSEVPTHDEVLGMLVEEES